MLSPVVQEALSKQVNMELSASYNYLAMSAYCQLQNFPGSASWLRIQSQEEYGHAMKLYDFLLSRDCPIAFAPVAEPQAQFDSVTAVFESVLAQEKDVTASINNLFGLALAEKAFAESIELQWFITEQVEEEQNAREVVAKFKMCADDAPSLLELDREMGTRQAAPAAEGA